MTYQEKRQRKEDQFNYYQKYCHSHGAGQHNEYDCKKTKDGHKKEATFKNMMGGSTAFCQGCN